MAAGAMRWKNESQNAATPSAKTIQRTATSLLVQRVRKPETDAGEHVEQHQRDDLDHHERHHPGEDLVQRHVLGCYAFQVERRHRDGRRKEGRLEVERYEQAEEQRIDAEMRQE